MAKFKLQTRNRTHPMIYAFTTSDIPHLNGWVKIGKTEKQSVEERIRQEVHTIGIKNYKIEWALSEYFGELKGKKFILNEMASEQIEKIDDLSDTAKILLSAVAGAVIQHLIDNNCQIDSIFKNGYFIVKYWGRRWTL